MGQKALKPPDSPIGDREGQLLALREFALSLPDAHEEHPWGHGAIEVRKKTFVFLYAERHDLKVSTKLPDSGAVALNLPFAKPTGDRHPASAVGCARRARA